MVKQINCPLYKESRSMKSETAGKTVTDYFYMVKAADPSRNLGEDSNQGGEFDRGTIGGIK